MPINLLTAVAAVEVLQLCVAVLVWRRQRRRITALTSAAGIDDLTGLPGRRGLHTAYAAHAAAGTPPGVLLVDLTSFKEVNDRYGHDTGDALLRQVAARLTHVAGDHHGAVAGRLGGDEFVLLLPNPTQAQLVGAAAHVRQVLAAPVAVDGVDEPLTVSCVIGVAPPGTAPEPGRPFRAADIALYHARHHRQPWALYRPGMTHPVAVDRHGPRLRERRPALPVVTVDAPLFDRLAAGQVSSDVAHADDVADLRQLVEVLDPGGRDFGTDVADLVARCVEHRVLRLHDPVTGLSVQPTVLGEPRDGGFVVLVHVADTFTLASGQLHPRDLRGQPGQPARLVLTRTAETASRVYDTYRAAHAPSAGGR